MPVEEHFFVIQNVLCVISMRNNIIPPKEQPNPIFILHQKGMYICNMSKIPVNDPVVQDHAIVFESNHIWIPEPSHISHVESQWQLATWKGWRMSTF